VKRYYVRDDYRSNDFINEQNRESDIIPNEVEDVIDEPLPNHVLRKSYRQRKLPRHLSNYTLD